MRFDTPEGQIEVDLQQAIVAGWTGRDQAAVQHHIDELAALGVSPPSSVPLFYRVSVALLTHAPQIEVLGSETSGEVEPLLLRAEGRLWLGLASDHTDRQLETVSVAASKQICAKPIARTLWPFESVADRLDRLILRCDIEEQGTWVTYQEGALSAIRPFADLMRACPVDEGAAMLCGTLGALGGVRPASAYRMTLEDPSCDAQLDLNYRVVTLSVVA